MRRGVLFMVAVAIPDPAFAGVCGMTDVPCDGSCVETAGGEACVASCTRDDECHTDDGYICDPQWKACLLPNFAAIVPKQCPAMPGPVRDLSFGASEPSVAANHLDNPTIVLGPDPKHKVATMFYAIDGALDDGLRVRASRDGGKTYGPAVTALIGSNGNATVGADGHLHIATINGDPFGAYGSAQQKIEYTVSADGGTAFSAPITASGRDEILPFYFSNPSVAVDDRRHWLYIAYARGGRDAKWDIVIAASKDAGKTWSRTKIGDDCALHMVPNLALDPTTGTLHVAWYDTDGAPGRFAHATCAPGAAKCVQQGAINSEAFTTLSTGRDSPKWIGDRERLIVDDKRRTLDATWLQPVEANGRIITRSFHATAALPKR